MFLCCCDILVHNRQSKRLVVLLILFELVLLVLGVFLAQVSTPIQFGIIGVCL